MEKKQIYLFTTLVSILVLGLGYRFYIKGYEAKKLEKTKQTKAVMISIHEGRALKATASGEYQYWINGSRYNYEESANFNSLSVGDTIIIKYSIENPSVARVVDKYYMKKYRHLKR